MKQFLSHFQKYFLNNLMLGTILVSNFAIMPPILHELTSLSGQVGSINSAEASIPLAELNNPDDNLNNGEANDKEDDDDGDNDSDDEDLYDFGTGLIIKAINPGYTLPVGDSTVNSSDVGEFIELQNLTNAPIALAGYSLKYDYGNSTTSVFTFPEGSYMTGKRLLLKYAKTPDSGEADLTYSKSLSYDSGPLRLVYVDEDSEEFLTDSVCWRKDTARCANYNATELFINKDGKRKVAVRDLIKGNFEQLNHDEYIPEFIPGESGLFIPEDDEAEELPEDAEAKGVPHCQGLEFSELLTYYTNDKSEQFIELFNPTAREINLEGCQISYKNKTYPLSGNIKSGEYYIYKQSSQFALTKNPKNPTTLTLLDADDSVVDEMAYSNGQKKSTSYARIFSADGKEDWQTTYAITPGAENIYQKFRNCEEGKIINEATGNCVKVSATKSVSSLAPCPAGKYRNPLTGRCKNIETASSTTKACAEGYERNPETNRCRKIKTDNDGAEYALVPNTHSDGTVFIGIGIVILIISLGVIYVILQFRHEIARAARKAGQRINHIRKNLLARGIGRHPHK